MAKTLRMRIAYCPLCNREHEMELLGRGLFVSVGGKMVYMDEDLYRCPSQGNFFSTEEHFAEILERARSGETDIPG